MIGMMYLFYTAMLALNMSKSVLHAFVVMNTGMISANINFSEKNAFIYSALDAAKANDPLKAEVYYKAALKIKKESKEMIEYIDDLKIELLKHLGAPQDSIDKYRKEGRPFMDVLKMLDKLDDYNASTHMMVGNGETKGKGHLADTLKQKLIAYREALLKELKNPKVKILNKKVKIKNLKDLGINVEDPKSREEDATWEMNQFYHMPAAATIAVFTQLENAVKNAEGIVLNELLNNITAADFKFDTLAAKVIPKTNYVIQGDQYEADLFVAAFSTTNNPTILVGKGYDTTKGELIPPVDTVPVTRGVGHYVVPANAIGPQHYAAVIRVKKPGGGYKEYPLMTADGDYGTDYTVARPSAVISPTKMNVLYVGVDNPISVSVSGFSDDKVTPHISQGSLRRVKPGQYIARVKKAGKAVISVSVKDDNGNSKTMGKQEFRVKTVPDPVAKVGGKKGGTIKKTVLLAQRIVAAELENFNFDLTFKVISFRVTVVIDGFDKFKDQRGNSFTAEQKKLIKRIRPGGRVMIENIKAKGPDGRVRKLSNIVLKLK
jgi:gliding motility-associated protein GldM